MNRLPISIITLLWFITIIVSFIILRDTDYFSKLAPIYFICMVGSIITVQVLVKRINSTQKGEPG